MVKTSTYPPWLQLKTINTRAKVRSFDWATWSSNVQWLGSSIKAWCFLGYKFENSSTSMYRSIFVMFIHASRSTCTINMHFIIFIIFFACTHGRCCIVFLESYPLSKETPVPHQCSLSSYIVSAKLIVIIAIWSKWFQKDIVSGSDPYKFQLVGRHMLWNMN